MTALFGVETRQEILAIPLTRMEEEDKVIWKENKGQSFSIKSAYLVALRVAQQQSSESSHTRRNEKVWKLIWSMNVPPKVRNFVWRVCLNILPTRANLQRRKIAVDPQFDFCKQQPETIGHMLWECPFARNTWALVRGRLQKCPYEATDIFLLLRELQDRLERGEVEV